MQVRSDEVVIYRWDDGWVLVRPTSREAFRRLYDSLPIANTWKGTLAFDDELSWNLRGGEGTAFLVRPLARPAGLDAGLVPDERLSAVVMSIFFQSWRAEDGRSVWIPNVNPGRYRPPVLEGFHHLYGLFLDLDDTIARVWSNRVENLLLPIYSEASLPALERFARHVAAVTCGVHVATDWDYWKPSSVPVHSPLGRATTRKLFESPVFPEIAATYRRQHDKGPQRFVVEVPLPAGDWDCVDDRALDVRPWLEGVADDPYWKRQARPVPVPAEAVAVPWTVTLYPSGDACTSTSLADALVGAGVVSRSVQDVVAFATRKAFRGRLHEGSFISLALAQLPSLFICPLGEVSDCAVALGIE